MNRKSIAMLAIVTLGLGAGGAIALQSRAQVNGAQTVTSGVSAPADVSTPSDTDNIQNDQGVTDMPDAVVQSNTATNGSGAVTAHKIDSSEHGENTATDASEVEDAN